MNNGIQDIRHVLDRYPHVPMPLSSGENLKPASQEAATRMMGIPFPFA
jgi:hypothetical protein